MKLNLPECALVLLVGPSGSGKSSFARKHFKPTEVLSSDYCRGLVCDDENDQTISKEAFEVLYFIATKRLGQQKLTVVDATNVKPEDRKGLITLARELHTLAVAIVFNIPAQLCHERNAQRPDRNFGFHVVQQHSQQLRRSLRHIKHEGFHQVRIFSTPEEIDAVSIERLPLWNNRRHEHGPFDIIGDIHGCYDELLALLDKLGYHVDSTVNPPQAQHPEGRRVIFLGDLVDRGPNSPAVLHLVMNMVTAGTALCVPGNHEIKLLRKLKGKNVRMTHGLAETLAQLDNEPEEFQSQVLDFIDSLIGHFVLDDGELVVAHAGLKAELQGRASGRVREFALYGETTGETDEFGLPVRYNWAADYRGRSMVVYGHTPVPEAQWTNRTICIDTGCVFGGKLTALRYPEKELVDVPAQRVYYEPARPFLPPDAHQPPSHERPYHDLLDLNDVAGKRVINTRVHHNVTIREENAVAALEAMSRFAIDPHWLIYLPPTMAPSDTCKEGAYLERPQETFDYFRAQGVPKVICQEKHMGSRAVIVLCRDVETAQRRFGVVGDEIGVIYTRTGRPFFTHSALNTAVIERLRTAVSKAGLWEQLETDWLCLDAEIMPWSAKAQALLRSQYAPTGAAAQMGLDTVVNALQQTCARGVDSSELLARFSARQDCIGHYIAAYQRYCWSVDDIDDLKIAPFHLLAAEQSVYINQDHQWHMNTLATLCQADSTLLHPTAFQVIDVTDPSSEQQGTQWWETLTANGSEGMVVKPLDWIVKGRRGLVQPASKCRGREYLRIIYGPEYTLPEQLERLRQRGLGVKRALALREFSLGIEALQRFVEKEPLFRVHECVFGVLALESEPVDPRL